MMHREKILIEFIIETLTNENCKNVQIVTKQNVSTLAQKLEKTPLQQLNIYPDFENINESSDLFIVFDDIELTETQIGTIKNLLSQKILIFSLPKDGINESKMIKLGFQIEVEDSKNNLLCFSYNLKTYNNKRSWNNAEGWANPENFNKYRW
ncbi:MAG: hypothetical protein ISQ64_03590 [SAR86 cluster bacterium]|uniref:Uncharacterized protein n=1 Tax=SAR86 cluster bacterium TaxID=2030880 RepID=A0A937LIX1_9GAMM|nr:hypothetical protein [SAR86 cluster bacterium]